MKTATIIQYFSSRHDYNYLLYHLALDLDYLSQVVASSLSR